MARVIVCRSCEGGAVTFTISQKGHTHRDENMMVKITPTTDMLIEYTGRRVSICHAKTASCPSVTVTVTVTKT